MNWKDLYLTYGNTFLLNEIGDGYLISMDHLGVNLLSKPAIDIFRIGNFSYAYFGGAFDYSAMYYIVDSAGNYASVEEYQAERYFRENINDSEFLDWLFEGEYIAEDEYFYLQDDI